MRVIVLTPHDHFHSPIILRELGLRRGQDFIGVITTPKFTGQGNIVTKIYRLIKRSGYDYLLSMALAKGCFSLLTFFERYILQRQFSKREYLTVKEVMSHYSFPHHFVKDINSPSTVNLIRKLKSDVIVGALFNQLVKKDILDIASMGCLNIHTSYLPKYRGIGPNFWALVNNEETSGAAIHLMTERIDDGAIICKERVSIEPKDTFFSLYRKCAEVGARLLIGTLGLCSTTGFRGEKQDEQASSYFSIITPEAVRNFRANGRKFFKIR